MYELHEAAELGQGGYATVYLATHRETGTKYACKVIDLRVLSACSLKRLEDELAALNDLKGAPNVAEFQDAFKSQNRVYILMELCTGGDLIEAVKEIPKCKGLAYKEARVGQLMREVMKILDTCHSKGILHRDVKPENFLLSSKRRKAQVKAIDFGVSCYFYKESPDPQCVGVKLQGTPWYISPEAAIEERFCPSGDIWAAGVMAYYLLTDKFPFVAESGEPEDWEGVLEAIRNGSDEQLQLNLERDLEGYSQAAKDFIKATMQRDRYARPTAQEATQLAWLNPSSRPHDHHHLGRVEELADQLYLKYLDSVKKVHCTHQICMHQIWDERKEYNSLDLLADQLFTVL
jgi:calcium-dependent protein kinase